MTYSYQSWGGYPRARHKVKRLSWRDAPLPAGPPDSHLLPYGNGRSYGDCCLNDMGILLDTRGLRRFIDFDRTAGILCCEAGVLLGEILELIVPQGWFLPVTPGTQHVTVGGAIANDVHGKNHHRAGTFGCHVRRFELLRSDGSRLLCSPSENPDWYRATVGGLGLTGVILWAEITLKPINNPYLDVETLRIRNLAHFFELSGASDRDHEYTVAWIDCHATGPSLGRGLFMRANHAPAFCPKYPRTPARRLTVPIRPPFSLINRLSTRLISLFYYYKQLPPVSRSIDHYQSFFYALDGIGAWNRLYGRAGFLQYQCVVTGAHAEESISEILGRLNAARAGSFLAVLKVFGEHTSPGILSFPRPGVTLALDLPYQGLYTLDLLARFDEVVRAAAGAVYPAKDARMSSESFQRFFPGLTGFKPFVDRRFSSSFWRRVMEEEG